ncbi:MAG: fused response regulator/phosphatase [Gammaproteobacteria bacterium]|nr:fused response regulator/phosphatase [Gammaproteobacteria bacterium]
MGVGDSEILVVEQPSGAESELQRLLQDSGFKTTNVTTEGDCLSQIRTSKPDLVLLSLTKSVIDAHSLISEILKIDANLPIILTSVDGEEDKLVSLLEAGAADFLRFVSGQGTLLKYVIEKTIQRQSIHELHIATEEKLEYLNLKLGENLKILERDQQAGFRVQRGMMPVAPTTIIKVTFDHRIFPSLILSGDFIDYFELQDRRMLFYIADVSGHGASSAFVTVLLKSLSRRLQRDYKSLGFDSPGSILTWLNRELLQCDLEQHVTMFLGIVDCEENTLEYSNAAQFPAAILSSDDGAQFLEIGGLPLGLYQAPEYDSRSVSLPLHFTIVMFSDGVFEIMPQQTLKAKEEHLLSVVKCGKRDVEALAEQLGIESTREVPDDIAVFTVAGVG